MKEIIIIGGRGNGTVIASVIEDINKLQSTYKILGFLNDGEDIGTIINDYPVLGKVTKEECDKYPNAYFIYTLISVGKAEERVNKLNSLQIPDEKWINIYHPSAVISSHCKLGKGVILMPNVILSPNVTLGDYVQVYGNSIVGHDTTVKDYCFISNSSSIGSFIEVGEGVHIGSNSTIRERVKLGDYSLIGMGSIVLKDTEPFSKNVGVPAKKIGVV
jgi:acetyltransferase EpsM